MFLARLRSLEAERHEREKEEQIVANESAQRRQLPVDNSDSAIARQEQIWMSEIAVLADEGHLAAAKRLGQLSRPRHQRAFVGAQREHAGEVFERLVDELSVPGGSACRGARVMEVD